MKALLARWLFGRTGGMRHALPSWPLALLIVVALHAVSAWMLAGLSFNNAPELYYPAGSPAVVLRDELRRDFPGDEQITVLFRGDDLYGAAFLERLERAVTTLERDPLVDRVSAVTNMERISGSADGFAVEPLIDRQLAQAGPPAAVRDRVMGDRFAPGVLASRDGRHLAMTVRPKALTSSMQRVQLKLAVARAVNEAGLRSHYAGDAGPISVDVAQLESIFADSRGFVPLTFIVGLALMAWAVGRWRPVLIGAVAMSTVVLPTLAVLAWSGVPYTMASAILPSLLAAYTVANLLHLYAGVQRAQRTLRGRAATVDQALADTRKPALFNTLTTVAGVGSLVLVPIPPIQAFGVFAALGTVAVFLTVNWLVPPFLRHWDRQPWPQHRSAMGRLGRLARSLTVFSIRHPKWVLAGFVGVMLLAAPAILKVQVETDLLAFFADDHPVNVQTRAIEKALVGVTTLEVSLQGGERDTFQRVDILNRVQALQRWLDSLPEVDRSISMVDLVEEMHWAMNDEDPAFRALPNNDRLLRQYLLVYDGQDLGELVNRDYQHARMLLSLNVHGTQAIRHTIDTIRARLEAVPIPGVKVDVGGYGRLLTDQVDLLVQGQVNSFFGAFGQIFLLMALLWRSFAAAGVCLVPNLAPLFFVFVLMGLAAIRLDAATVMIASVVLGITIDDTVHLFHGYRERLRHGMAPIFAIVRSYDATGRAVLATSAILVIQFGLLAMSDFVPTSNFGLMTATGLLTGVVFELLLLPALLVMTFHRKLGSATDGRRRRGRWPRLLRPTPAALPSTAAAATAAAESDAVDPAWAPTVLAHELAPRPATAIDRVLVCTGARCREAGGRVVLRHLLDEEARLLASDPARRWRITRASCLGPCRHAPVMQVYPQGTFYGSVDPRRLGRIVAEHLVGGRVVGDLALTPAQVEQGEGDSGAQGRRD